MTDLYKNRRPGSSCRQTAAETHTMKAAQCSLDPCRAVRPALLALLPGLGRGWHIAWRSQLDPLGIPWVSRRCTPPKPLDGAAVQRDFLFVVVMLFYFPKGVRTKRIWEKVNAISLVTDSHVVFLLLMLFFVTVWRHTNGEVKPLIKPIFPATSLSPYQAGEYVSITSQTKPKEIQWPQFLFLSLC